MEKVFSTIEKVFFTIEKMIVKNRKVFFNILKKVFSTNVNELFYKYYYIFLTDGEY